MTAEPTPPIRLAVGDLVYDTSTDRWWVLTPHGDWTLVSPEFVRSTALR